MHCANALHGSLKCGIVKPICCWQIMNEVNAVLPKQQPLMRTQVQSGKGSERAAKSYESFIANRRWQENCILFRMLSQKARALVLNIKTGER